MTALLAITLSWQMTSVIVAALATLAFMFWVMFR